MDTRGFAAALDALVAGTRSVQDVTTEMGAGIELLPGLVDRLTSDLPIAALERLEELVKAILAAACSRGTTGAEARAIAEFQKRVGFLLKYKSYAVKCANPLGYSLFLQNAGEGFSFQRHTEHKVEVFHILDVLPGGYAFICDYSEWREVFEPDAFARWLAGEPDARYDRYRYELSPGDVLVIDELNVVHAVLGAVLEEFANVSTDMVDRLYDQNSDAEVPAGFDRDFVRERLGEVRYPAQSRFVYGGEGPVPSEPVEGGSVRVLADSFVTANVYTIDAGASGPALADDSRAASLYVSGGAGELTIADAGEPIALAKGDLLTIVPRTSYRPANTGSEPLTLSEHRIAPEVAFGPGTGSDSPT